jgi:hypothetical protein
MTISALLVVTAAVCAVLGAAMLMACVASLKRHHFYRTAMALTSGMLMLALAMLCGTISVATLGYRALTREETAAVVTVEPTGSQRFSARFVFPDGSETVFLLTGDEIYVDAHILKWKPIVNILGMHTAYELDRVGGRYRRLEDERAQVRTVYSLSRDKPVNMFDLRRRFAILSPLLDAEYGSATFIRSDRSARYSVNVSTTGLLIRRQ